MRRLKLKWFFYTVILALFFAANTFAGDESCKKYDPSTGVTTWEGVRCTVDQNKNGYIDDCSELLACSKPNSGGYCNQSPASVGYQCLTNSQYFVPTGFDATGLDPILIHYVSAGTELAACMNYDPGTGVGCPDQTCTAMYQYECTKNSVKYPNAELCQTNCGGQCTCEDGGLYNPVTGLCEVSSSSPCPDNYPYDYSLGMCATTIYCPTESVFDPILNQCVTNTSFQCPTGFTYNSSTGKCQAVPQCAGGTYYNPTTDKCESATCPAGFTLNSQTWRCEYNFSCPSGTFNPGTGFCEDIFGTCSVSNPADTNPDYVKNLVGISERVGCECTDCVSKGGMTYVDPTPAGYICIGPLYEGCWGEQDGKYQRNRLNVYGKPYVCSRTGVLLDKDACESSCSCSVGYTQKGAVCEKNPCKLGETLDIDNKVCWVVPTSLGTGACSNDKPYTAKNGRCEASFDCGATGTYNPQTGKCEAEGIAACETGYVTQGAQCVAAIPCYSPAVWNSTRDRCEQSNPYFCEAGYTYSSTTGYCQAPITCPAGDTWLGSPIYSCQAPGNGVTPCDSGYTPDSTISTYCTGPIQCPAGDTWRGYYSSGNTNYAIYGCQYPAYNPCDTGYTWVGGSYQWCEATPVCSPGSTWMGTVKVGTAYIYGCRSLQAGRPCDSGYTLNPATGNCEAAKVCPYGATMTSFSDQYGAQIPTCKIGSSASSEICTVLGYSYNSTRNRCEDPPICVSGTSYNSVRDRCESMGSNTCPPSLNWNPPYCEGPPDCLTGSVYNAATDSCETTIVQFCPIGGYPCSAGQCTGTEVCNAYPAVVTVTGGDLAIKLSSFTSAPNGTGITFTRTNGSKTTLTLNGCTVSGSGSILNSLTFSASGSSISFYDASAVLMATINFTGCMASGSGTGLSYGPIANGGNSIDFFSGVAVLTPAQPTIYSCPLDPLAACSADPTPTCTVSAACVNDCPAGFTLSGGVCKTTPICTGGSILNTQRDMCQLNAAGTVQCPTGQIADTINGVCYSANVGCKDGGTLDTVNDICQFASCPGSFTWCTNTTWCQGLIRPGPGCIQKNGGTCLPTPNAVKAWSSGTMCYEHTGCTEHFTYCPTNQGCNFKPGYTMKNVGQYDGCYGDYTIQTCPGTPTATSAWYDAAKCYERTGGQCPANYTYCEPYQSCNFNGYTSNINQYGGCYADDSLESCLPTPNALSSWKDRTACWEQMSTNCPVGYTFCSKYQNCTIETGNTVATGIHSGCFGKNSVEICPASVALSKYQSNCRRGDNPCQSGNRNLDSANQRCWGNPRACPLGGTLDIAIDKCTKPPLGIQCPSGFTWNVADQACQKTPICPTAKSPESGKTLKVYFDGTNAVCWTCYDGFIFNPAAQVCQKDPYCATGSVLNPVTNVCETIVEISCPAGLSYDPSSGKCISPADCPVPSCGAGCYDKNINTCNSALTPPCSPIDPYNPILKKCTLTGTPACPANYVFNPSTKKCESAPVCAVSDWVCPADLDPVCQEGSPYANKFWKEDTAVTPTEYTTYATTVNPMSYPELQTQIQTSGYEAPLATVGDKEDVWGYYGTGPFWLQNGALYQDVYFNIMGSTTCYDAQDFLGRVWRPKNYANTHTCPATINNWERIENSCVCKTFQVKTYQKACAGAGVNETLISTVLNNSDISTCNADPVPTCSDGVKQEGLNECDKNREEFSGSIICNGIPYSEFKTVTTCSAQMNAIIPVEYRTIPSALRGVIKWPGVKCTPCLTGDQGIVDDDVTSGEEPDIDQELVCTNLEVFSGVDRRCDLDSIATLWTNCCAISGWFTSWCNNEERELKKRKEASTCKKVGSYCSKKIKFLGVCLKKKESYCCFNSKLARIMNDQGRTQISKSWGSAKNPDCTGFSPEEMSTIDMSSMDLSEFIADMQEQMDPSGAAGQAGALEGVQKWYGTQSNVPPASGGKRP